jgi:hypothetical protein
MSQADQFPDPDLSFLDGPTGFNVAAVGRGLDDAAQQLEKQTRAITDIAQTATVDRVHEVLVGVKQSLDVAATNAAKVAQVFASMHTAWEVWKAHAPRQAEIAFAERSVADARERLMAAAANEHHTHTGGKVTAECRAQLKYAEAKLNELIRHREDADKALADALASAEEQLKLIPNDPNSGKGGPPTNPSAPAPKSETPAPPAASVPAPAAPGPGASAPAPVGELPGTALPGAPLSSPDTSLSATPETPAATTGSGLSPAQAGALAAALGQQQQQGQAQPQAQPQMAPAMAAPMQQQKPAENPFAKSDNYDPNALLASLAAAPLAATGLAGASPATYAAPAITPLNPASTSFSPATLWNTPGGSLTPAPALNPIVTGTSVSGLTTDSNVTGRADGATPRTATSPSPATNLSGASGAETAATRAGAGTGAGMGAPMVPMSPMMGGMGNSGASKDREMVNATMTPEQAKLLGLETIGEAVPGGTIARKED